MNSELIVKRDGEEDEGSRRTFIENSDNLDV
jgi:hypothetical protein